MKIRLSKIYLWPASLAVIFMSSIIIIVSPVGDKTIIPIPTFPQTNNDLVVGLQIANCCPCPVKVPNSRIGTDGWVTYVKGKDYSGLLPKSCSRVSCKPCEPITDYTCPSEEWVDCMPNPDSAPKPQCRPDYLKWAKDNCPNFKGAAL